MSFRTVVITKRCKLSYKNGYMIIRSEDVKMIHLSEIYALILDTTAVSITSYLLKELSQTKTAVIVCDEEHNPTGQYLPLYGHHHSSKMVKLQTEWEEINKQKVWTEIITNKILAQAKHLADNSKTESEMLYSYIDEIEFNDETNREGHAAKVYFNSLFGKDFSRDKKTEVNAALNYGYAILLSLFNKEIVASGYITQLGIKHKNEFNDFNLSCDLMEPFRIIIDRYVYNHMPTVFDSDYKHGMISIFNETFDYSGGDYYLTVIISMYVKNVLKAIETGETRGLKFVEL